MCLCVSVLVLLQVKYEGVGGEIDTEEIENKNVSYFYLSLQGLILVRRCVIVLVQV